MSASRLQPSGAEEGEEMPPDRARHSTRPSIGAAAASSPDIGTRSSGQPSGAEEEAPKGAAAAATPAGLNAKARRKLKRAQEKELEAAPKGTAAESAIIGEARKAAACLEAAEKAATTTAAAVTAAQAVANSAHAAWKTAATALVGSSTAVPSGEW